MSSNPPMLAPIAYPTTSSSLPPIVTMMDNNTSLALDLVVANETIPRSKWSFEFSVIMATILSISSLMTIVGNVMVLTVIFRHRVMRTQINLFLVNLAIADLLVGLMVVPFSITTLIEGKWIFTSDFMCALNGWINGLCLITSIHTLMYIGINKYFSIMHPLSNPIKLKHIIFMMVAAWAWGAICATLSVTGLNHQHYKEGTSQCGPAFPTELKGYVFHGLVQTTCTTIPLVILLFCYIQIFREIRRHSERLRNHTTVQEDFILSQQKKVTVTLFIVLACFVLMNMPYFSYASYSTIKKDKSDIPKYYNPVAYCFLYLNSMCNPIIYAFRSPQFREGYKEILCHTPSYIVRDGPMGTMRYEIRRSSSNATNSPISVNCHPPLFTQESVKNGNSVKISRL